MLGAALRQHWDGNASSDSALKAGSVPTSLVPLAEAIRVEVLNGCGAPSIAGQVAKKLRALGLDVIDEGNAESFAFPQSLVIDRCGDLEKARQVAALVGIPHCIQQVRDDPSRLAQISIIIGKDYQQLDLFAH